MKNFVSTLSVTSLPVSPDGTPTTPKSMKINFAPLDSTEREKKRQGLRGLSMNHKLIDDFRMKILAVYRNYFARICADEILPNLTYDFIFDTNGDFADNRSISLTDEKFDQADLSIVLLAIDKGLPLFVNNKAMKGQVINSSVLRHSISKDVIIVDFGDLDKSQLNKVLLEKFSLEKFGKNKAWGVRFYRKIGVADTGFISRLAKLDKIDLSLKGAFLVPKFVKEELARKTTKPVVPYRMAVGEEINVQIQKQLDVADFLSGGEYVGDFLNLFTQPQPDLEVSKLFDIQKAAVKGKEREEIVLRLLKTCSAFASISGNNTLSIAEENVLYEIYRLIHGSNASRDSFHCGLFLANITQLAPTSASADNSKSAAENMPCNLTKVAKLTSIDELLGKLKNKTNQNLLDLDESLKILIHNKSAESYHANKVIKEMSVLFSSAFGPLYNIYRSKKVNSIIDASISNTLCLEFNKFLLQSLDKDSFDRMHENKESVNRLNKVLIALSQDLFEGVFKEISDFIATERSLKDELAIKACQASDLSPPPLSNTTDLSMFHDGVPLVKSEDAPVSAYSLHSSLVRRPLSNLDVNSKALFTSPSKRLF